MPRCSILWDLGSQNLLWVALEKICIESESKLLPFTYTGIYIFLSLGAVAAIGEEKCFVLFGLLKLRGPDNESLTQTSMTWSLFSRGFLIVGGIRHTQESQ